MPVPVRQRLALVDRERAVGVSPHSRTKGALPRLAAVLLLLEGVYVAGFAFLVTRWSATFSAFDNGAEQGGVNLLPTLGGLALLTLLVLTALGLWLGWAGERDGRMRGRLTRLGVALTILLHGAVVLFAIANSYGAAAGTVLLLAILGAARLLVHAQPTV